LWLTFRKDILTPEYLQSLGLNERQVKAMQYVKEKGRITNTEYQEFFGVSKKTASNDLGNLEKRGILERTGTKGAGTFYCLAKKGIG
jgi:ATP-dependent DNA helicase RecG